MLSSIFTFTTIVALCGTSSATALSSRDVTDGIKLYAYGPGIGGAPVFYADGVAMLGDETFSTAAKVTNLTFSSDLVSDTTPWYAYSNESLWSATEAPALYIVNTTKAYEAVGFTAVGNSTNTTIPTGAATVGFAWYGTTVTFVGSNGDYEMKFYATNTTDEGVYNLLWNEGNTVDSSAVPVTLKRTAPSRRLAKNKV